MTGVATITGRSGIDADLGPDGHDPLMLQELSGRSSLPGVADETSLQEVDSLGAQLVTTGQLGWVSLCNIVHDGPLVIQAGPRTTACGHLKDDAAQRPDVYGALFARVLALDDFGRHVHGRSRHGFVGVAVGMRCYQRLSLAGDDLCGAEIHVLNYSRVIEQNI